MSCTDAFHRRELDMLSHGLTSAFVDLFAQPIPDEEPVLCATCRYCQRTLSIPPRRERTPSVTSEPTAFEVPSWAYRGLWAVNFTALKHLRQSPLHYRHALRSGFSDTVHARVGRGGHCLALEPENFDSRFFVWTRTRDRKSKAYKEFAAAHPDLDILTSPEYDRARGVADALSRNEDARALLSEGETEVPLVWRNIETGLWCKGQLDFIPRERIGDLKSTNDISEHAFSRKVAEMGYHVQLAMYDEGARANGYDIRTVPLIIAVESDAPYDVAIYECSDDMMREGRKEFRRLLETLKRCWATQDWYGQYAGERVPLALPGWYGAEETQMLTIAGEALEI